jgi:integrase
MGIDKKVCAQTFCEPISIYCHRANQNICYNFLMTSIVVARREEGGFESVIKLVVDGVTSSSSQRAYAHALDDFRVWYLGAGKPGLNRATVQAYRAHLQAKGLAPATINLALSAIRKLAREAAYNGLLDAGLLTGILDSGGVRTRGVRAGFWLTRDQAQQLLNSPDTQTLKGKRDRAMLAVLIGGGLRRSEVASLTFEQLQQREARWVIVDLLGKGRRLRTVPIPSWTKAAIDEWAAAAGVHHGRVFRGVYRGGRLLRPDSMSISAQIVYSVVAEYAGKLGLKLASHDLRRTFAKLAYKGGASLDQIQITLGHASIQTTERYLGVQQNMADAPCDRLGLS